MAAKKAVKKTAAKVAPKPTMRAAVKAATNPPNPKANTGKKFTSEKKQEAMVSPAGIAAYAWLSKPDLGKQFSDGKYKVTLVLDKDDADHKAWCKKLHVIVGSGLIKDGDVVAKKKDKPEFEGKYLITAKTKNKPKVVDAKRRELPAGVSAMSGDLIKVVILPNEYDAGKWNLYLNAVQIIDKRSHGGDASGLFEEESGYEAPEGVPADASEESGKAKDDTLDF